MAPKEKLTPATLKLTPPSTFLRKRSGNCNRVAPEEGVSGMEKGKWPEGGGKDKNPFN